MHKAITAACALVAVVGLTSCGGDAPARPTSWKPFCAELRDIKSMSETPGGWTTSPTDPYGLKTLATKYDRLEHIVPSAQVATSLAARPLLGHGVVEFTPAVKKAMPAAQKLRPVFIRQCELEVSDVFKIGFP